MDGRDYNQQDYHQLFDKWVGESRANERYRAFLWKAYRAGVFDRGFKHEVEVLLGVPVEPQGVAFLMPKEENHGR